MDYIEFYIKFHSNATAQVWFYIALANYIHYVSITARNSKQNFSLTGTSNQNFHCHCPQRLPLTLPVKTSKPSKYQTPKRPSCIVWQGALHGKVAGSVWTTTYVCACTCKQLYAQAKNSYSCMNANKIQLEADPGHKPYSPEYLCVSQCQDDRGLQKQHMGQRPKKEQTFSLAHGPCHQRSPTLTFASAIWNRHDLQAFKV